jgi:hypothetical protein
MRTHGNNKPAAQTRTISGKEIMRSIRKSARALLVTMLFVSPAARGDDVKKFTWTGSFVSRLEALALLETLNAELLSHDSATLTLDKWCEDHRLASPARIVAEFVHGADKAPSADQRKTLGISESEPVRYRQVRLSCGGHVLSEAENWYVPGRLTPDINHVLETTDTAFGRAAKSLNFHRRTLAATLLWSPLPEHWEIQNISKDEHAADALAVPHHVLQHVAVLSLPDGQPISQVIETYTDEILNFPQPAETP